jgi:hypothetical protein
MSQIKTSSVYFFLMIILVCSGPAHCQNQGLSNLWYMGYASWAGPPTGGIDIDFMSGSPVINYVNRPMDLNRTHSNISDANGNVLFYTNGYYIADASNDTMSNGSNISPTGYISVWPEGLTIPQATLIIPKPNNSQNYFIFHNTLDNAPYYNKSHFLYLTEVDISLNFGMGAVISKNQILIQDTLNPGKISAIKHANGRDWWIICQRSNSDKLYTILLTPNGVSNLTFQNIGMQRPLNISQATFSPDGEWYADFSLESKLNLFHFDRCLGIFAQEAFIPIGAYNYFVGGGVAFSPNSNVLYVSDLYEVYQYDLTASNIAASEQLIATWDSTDSPNPPFATLFENAELAPDGKIYITTGNSTFKLHVINYPDSLGLACDLVQHGITLPAFYFNTLPNHPNYFLGCDTTSSCPCLTTGNQELSEVISLKSYPNPTTGSVTFQFPVQSSNGEFEVYDVNGLLVHKDYVAPWSQYKKVDLSNFTNGIYMCKMRWSTYTGENKTIMIKISLQK